MATEVKLPDVGEGIESGTVVGVLVKEGDRIHKDQPLVELETDKAVVEVPSSAAGVITSVNVKEGEEARIGAVLVVIDESADANEEAASDTAASGADSDGAATDGDSATHAQPADAQPADGEPAVGEKAAATADAPAAAGPAPAAAPENGKPGAGAAGNTAATPSTHQPDEPQDRLVPAAPSVRRLAREMGLDINRVNGSGVLGRISAADVRNASAGAGTDSADAGGAVTAAGVAAPALPDFSRYGETERSAMSGVRKATLRAMTTAWGTVPMVTHFDEADITELEKFRKRYQPAAEEVGAKITPTAILLKVVAVALKRFPDFNASIDVEKLEVVHKHYINVGVAVDTPAGLLVPVVKDADKKGIIELAKELGELAEKARERKLKLEEMQGGNFSISNLGGIGGVGFTPIVTPPEVGILGVSRASVSPVWNKGKEVFEPRTMMPLSLTYDHRLIDGAAAARFLRWICQALEEPFVVALEG